eukprot:5308455-Alexandrium_andersonii.AAC.1
MLQRHQGRPRCAAEGSTRQRIHRGFQKPHTYKEANASGLIQDRCRGACATHAQMRGGVNGSCPAPFEKPTSART